MVNGALAGEAGAARGEPDRPFRRDVNEVGIEIGDEARDPARIRQRQTDFAIARQRQGPEIRRRQKADIDTEAGRMGGDIF